MPRRRPRIAYNAFLAFTRLVREHLSKRLMRALRRLKIDFTYTRFALFPANLTSIDYKLTKRTVYYVARLIQDAMTGLKISPELQKDSCL